MINGRFISYKAALAELLNDFPFAIGNYTEEDLLRSIKELIRQVGMTNIYKPVVEILEVKNSMVDIPSDLYYINSIAATDVTTVEEAEAQLCEGKLKLYRMKYNGDEMMRRLFCSLEDFKAKTDAAYILASDKILPNFNNGIIVISYLTHVKDDDGFPMIPDNESWMKAVVWTTALRIARRLKWTNKLTIEEINYIEQQQCWYVAQAGNQSRMLTKDQRIGLKDNNLSWPMGAFEESSFFANINRRKHI